MLNAAPPWRPACVTPLVIVCHALMSISGICNTCFQLVNQYIRVLSCTPQLPDCLDLVFIFFKLYGFPHVLIIFLVFLVIPCA